MMFIDSNGTVSTTINMDDTLVKTIVGYVEIIETGTDTGNLDRSLTSIVNISPPQQAPVIPKKPPILFNPFTVVYAVFVLAFVFLWQYRVINIRAPPKQ